MVDKCIKIASKGNCIGCGEPGYMYFCPACKIQMKIYDTITIQVKETYETFVFTTIRSYLEDQIQMKVSKKLLIMALEEFKTNHPDIWNKMSKTED